MIEHRPFLPSSISCYVYPFFLSSLKAYCIAYSARNNKPSPFFRSILYGKQMYSTTNSLWTLVKEGLKEMSITSVYLYLNLYLCLYLYLLLWCVFVRIFVSITDPVYIPIHVSVFDSISMPVRINFKVSSITVFYSSVSTLLQTTVMYVT